MLIFYSLEPAHVTPHVTHTLRDALREAASYGKRSERGAQELGRFFYKQYYNYFLKRGLSHLFLTSSPYQAGRNGTA